MAKEIKIYRGKWEKLEEKEKILRTRIARYRQERKVKALEREEKELKRVTSRKWSIARGLGRYARRGGRYAFKELGGAPSRPRVRARVKYRRRKLKRLRPLKRKRRRKKRRSGIVFSTWMGDVRV